MSPHGSCGIRMGLLVGCYITDGILYTVWDMIFVLQTSLLVFSLEMLDFKEFPV